MTETVVLIFEIIGTIAFSLSGAMVGIKKGMDIFGVVILGLTTAVGGGIIRDLLLGLTPPATFQNPLYAIVAVCTAIIIFIPAVRRLFEKRHHIYEITLLVMDSLGLGVFTVVGVQIAYAADSGYSTFLILFVGVITGVGGGVIRDMAAGNMPYIFVKHFYACASLGGAAIAIVLWDYLPSPLVMLIGALVVVILRLLAAYFHWSLPKARQLEMD